MRSFFKKIIAKVAGSFGLRIIKKEYDGYNPARYLLVEKNKYLLERRKDKEYDIIDDFINNEQTYNHIWSSNDFIKEYLDPLRRNLFLETLKTIEIYSGGNTIKTVLDIGCGTGDFLKILSERWTDCKIHGFDYSESSILRCRQILPTGRFEIKSIHDISMKDGHFDMVFCMEVLEHIEFPKNALKKISSIVNKGGSVVITIPDGRIDRWIGHINFWSLQEFTELCKGAGLHVVKTLEMPGDWNLFIARPQF